MLFGFATPSTLGSEICPEYRIIFEKCQKTRGSLGSMERLVITDFADYTEFSILERSDPKLDWLIGRLRQGNMRRRVVEVSCYIALDASRYE